MSVEPDSGTSAAREAEAGITAGASAPDGGTPDGAGGAEAGAGDDNNTAKRTDDTLKETQRRLTEAAELVKDLKAERARLKEESDSKAAPDAMADVDDKFIEGLSAQLLEEPEKALKTLFGKLNGARAQDQQQIAQLRYALQNQQTRASVSDERVKMVMDVVDGLDDVSKVLRPDEKLALATKIAAQFSEKYPNGKVPATSPGSTRRPGAQQKVEKPSVPDEYYKLSGADSEETADSPMWAVGKE